MFLQLNHQKLEVYEASRLFVLECYKLSNSFPPEERFNMTQQVRRAALSVHLNIAEGSSRKSVKERKRYYEISRGSIVEIDSALDAATGLGYIDKKNLNSLGDTMVKVFKLLSGLINAQQY